MASPDARGSPSGLVPRGLVSAAERRALTKGAGVVTRGDLARFRLTGGGRVACLQGLVTCDVDQAGDDSLLYGALLTAKGMIVSPLWITRLAASLLIEAPAAAADRIEAVLERSLPPRLCRYDVATAEMASVGVYGPAAAEVLRAAAGEAGPAAPGRVAELGSGERRLVAARVAARGLDGFDCLVAAGAAGGLRDRLVAAGAVPVTTALLEERRILAGYPELATEVDERTLPQEVRLDELGAVSYTKGCYLGQETVARVHFRGHANRRLAGVASEQAPGTLPMELSAGDRPVGRLTSACWWEAGGGYAGLAVLRREAQPGAAVRGAGGWAGTARELPWEGPAEGTGS